MDGGRQGQQSQYEDQSDLRRSVKGFRISPEEEALMKQCKREARLKRCLPLMVLFSGIYTRHVIRSKKETTNIMVGAKLLAINMFAYITGHTMYAPVCRKKFMEELPNSRFSKLMKNPQEFANMITEIAQEEQAKLEKNRKSVDPCEIMFKSSYNDSPPNSIPGDNQEQNQPRKSPSYEEMRRQNRKDYEKNLGFEFAQQNQQTPQATKEYPPPESPSRPQPKFSADHDQPPRREKRNKYGDLVFDDNDR